MRRRLMLAMVGLVAVVLLIAGVGSLVLTRIEARNDAKAQLVSEADSLRSVSTGKESLKVLHIIHRTLRLENASLIRIDPAGNVTTHLPHGLTPEQLDLAAIEAGETTSGRAGNVVYAAAPVDLTPLERVRLHHFEGTLAILLTRNVGALGPSWEYFIVAGAAALAVAALVAWQMSRRMSRPLVEAVGVTARIAAGDLESRVPVRAHDYPEFSSLAGSINHMAQSLEDSRARERHLLLAVSHDLRTPLTSIRGFAEAIHDGAVEDEGRAADVIIAESRRLERLVGRPPRPDQARGAPDVHLTAPDRRRRGGEHDVGGFPAGRRQGRPRRSWSMSPRGGPISGRPRPIRTAWHNCWPTSLRTRWRSPGPRSPSPTGPTRRPAPAPSRSTTTDQASRSGDLERVFERFYQADRGPNRRAGSGLGLAIVAELAAAMGGSVRAASPLDAGGGSRFVVTLRWWQGALPTQALRRRARCDPSDRGAAAARIRPTQGRDVYGSIPWRTPRRPSGAPRCSATCPRRTSSSWRRP